MKITIIETGEVPERVEGDYGTYPEMFMNLLRAADPTLTFETIALVSGARLPDPNALEGVLITGSPAGVYDEDPWIGPLLSFIRAAADTGVPQAGLCFGHQAIAKALGGLVEKSDKGWGIGRHTYDVTEPMAWMKGAMCRQISVAVSHQDQVIAPPQDSCVVAASDFTPFAGLSYRNGAAISFQCHPEFSPEYSAALYRSRIGHPFSQSEVDDAVLSLRGQIDNLVMGEWLAAYFQQFDRRY